jgi:hypothetical protein
MHGEIGGESNLLHGRGGDFVAAAARTVGLGDDGEKFEVALGE